MEFKQVQTFVALARHLHFGRTAEQLRIAQPHVSRRIRQLEEELDVVLFERDKRNVRLTKAGEVFLAEARTLLRDIELAKTHTKESALGRRGKLEVSLVGAAMLRILPRILTEFRRRYPDVHMIFREQGSVAQLEALAQGGTDVAFLHSPMRPNPAFDHVMLDVEPLIAVLPTGHRLARRTEIELAELADDPWVLFPREDNSPIYDRIIAVCARAGFSPKVVQEAGPVHSRLGLVASGFGVHLVGSSWRAMPFPGVVYLPIQPSATLGLACYWRKDDPNPILRLFVDVTRRHQM
ncbi:MAG: LysR substrate-binding domain-containing protein [Alphaproteobacteria bacterium]